MSRGSPRHVKDSGGGNWSSLSRRWSGYKYRFLPWLIFNFRRELQKQEARKASSQDEGCVFGDLVGHEADEKRLTELSTLLSQFQKPDPTIVFRKGVKRRRHFSEMHHYNTRALLSQWGFRLSVRRSRLEGAGMGVFVGEGRIARGQTAALYPGTIYEPWQPVLLQSIANQFILRCSDGVLVDGSHRYLSRIIFSSLHGRERVGNFPLCDPSWIERDAEGQARPANPLSVGQIVNNATDERMSNVTYHELDVLQESGHPEFRCHLPNIPYEAATLAVKNQRLVRIVPLIATRDIQQGEELYSSYLSIVPS